MQNVVFLDDQPTIYHFHHWFFRQICSPSIVLPLLTLTGDKDPTTKDIV